MAGKKSIMFTVALSVIGWGSLINVGLPLVGEKALVAIPPQYMSIVGIIACVWAFYLAMDVLAVVGRIGLVITSLPIFTLLGIVVQNEFGLIPACVAFAAPMFITLAYGMKGIISMAIVAAAAAFLAFKP